MIKYEILFNQVKVKFAVLGDLIGNVDAEKCIENNVS
jgi:hypothetical protein